MKKLLKISAFLVLVILLVIISIPFLFKGKIVSLIKTEANQKLYAHLDFKEDVSVSLLSSFPYLNIGIDDISVSGKGEFEKDTLISAKHIDVSLDLMSVIRGSTTEIRKVSLVAPRVLVRVLKDGRANYTLILPDSASETQADTGISNFKLALKLFEIQSGQLIYDDALYGVYADFQNMNYTLKGDFTQAEFILSNHLTSDAFTMKYGGVSWFQNVKTSLDADLEANMADFSFKFIKNAISLNELKLSLDGTFAMPGDDMQLDLKFGSAQTDFKNILSLIPGIYTKEFAQVKASGSMGLKGFVKGIYNEENLPSFGFELNVKQGGFAYPSMPVAAKNIALQLNISNPDGLPDHTVIDIPQFHAEAGNNPVDMKLHLTNPVSDPDIVASLKGKVVLNDLKQMIPIEATILEGIMTADCAFEGKMSYINQKQFDRFKACGNFGIQHFNYTSSSFPNGIYIDDAGLNFTPQFAELTSFHFRTVGTDLSATGKLENFIPYIFSDGVVNGNLTVNSNTCNLNEFMSEDSVVNENPNPADTVPLTAFSLPQNIDFVLKARAGTLYYDNLKLQSVSGMVSLKDGRARLTDMKAGIFGGTISMSGIYDPTNIKNPLVDFGIQMKEVNIQQLGAYCTSVSKYAGITQFMDGKMTAGFHVSGPMDAHMKPELQIISADGLLDIPAVKLAGFAPLDQMASALQQPKYTQLIINKIKAAFEIKDGNFYMKPFHFKLDQTEAKVSGFTGLDQRIDYDFDLMVPRNQLGQVNTELSNLLNQAASKGIPLTLLDKLPVRLKMTGTASRPKVQADFEEAKKLVVASLKGQLKAALDQKKKEMEDQAKKEAERLKQEAEKRAKEEADKLKQKAQEEADRLKKQAEEKSKAEVDKLKQQGKDKLKGGLDQWLRKK